ncbi:hypothetical protein GW916_01930 [bacterium]|nr:hypothetical protein [bacterium]
MADVIYNAFKKYIMNGSIDLDTDTINVMLVTSTYTPDQDLHEYRDDVTNEVTGTGYSAGGSALATKTVTADNTDNEGVFDADDVAWTTSTITARGAVLYKARGGASSADELICYIDFGSDKISTAGTFTIAWNAEGIVNLA